MRLCAIGVVLALAPAAALADPPTGNVLNPGGGELARDTDERGLTHLRPGRRRSPSGSLYPYPYEPPGYTDLTPSLFYRGSIEVVGLLTSGDEDVADFDRYSDLDDGVLVNDLVLALRSDRGFFANFHGGGIGRDDQYYRADLGIRGRVRVSGFYDKRPYRFTRDAVILFGGAGSESLVLPAPLMPGVNVVPAVELAVDAASKDREISIEHHRAGLNIEAWPHPGLKLFATYDRDEREGIRPFGGSLYFSFNSFSVLGSVVETVEPIDDVTHDFSAGLEYAREQLQANLLYQGSYYENEKESLSWENPFITHLLFLTPIPVERGRFALAPDNEWHNLRGDLALALPLAGRLTTSVSWGLSKQDEDLLPPTINSPLPAAYDPAGLWDTTLALSETSADAQIDTVLVESRLSLRPWRPLTLKGRFRFYDQDNRTRYRAVNPLNGDIGYVAEDGGPVSAMGSDSGIFDPSVAGTRVHFRSIPFGYQKKNWEVEAVLRPRARTSLTLGWEREEIAPDHRERDDTVEDRGRISIVTREHARATVRLSYEYADRDGSSYDFDPYQEFYASTPPLTPHTLPQLRKFDLADRVQQVIAARVNLLVREDMDLSFVAIYRDDNYDADYGLELDRLVDLNLELSIVPSGRLSSYAFVSYQAGESEMTTINPNPVGVPVYPVTNTWSLDSEMHAFALGAGFSVRLSERMTLDSAYRFMRTRERLDYDFASTGALVGALLPVNFAQAGSRFPSLVYEDQALELSLNTRLTEWLTARLFWLYRRSTIDDFSQTGLVPVSDHRLFLPAVDQDFRVSSYGAALQLTF